MNILIINQPPFNRGDESAHKGLIRTLLKRFPNTKIKVMHEACLSESYRQYAVRDKRVEYFSEVEGCIKFPRFRNYDVFTNHTWLWKWHPTYRRMERIYKWADIVVCAPGGICMGGFQDWNHLYHLRLAQLFKRPLAYYGRSFGPFPTETERNRQFKKISLDMLHYFGYLSIRDHKTELLADELNIPYISTIDSAFLDSPKVEIPYELKSVVGDKPYMVFVPNYLLWHYAYKGRISHETVINFYCKVMDEIWAANPELNILMLPQLFCGREYALNDVELFRDLAKAKNDSRIIITADCYSSDIQQTLISKAKYVIGARYHSIVFALNQGVPCIALSYEHKMAGLLETLGKTEWCIEFSKTLDSKENQEKCLEQIRKLIPSLKPDTEGQKKAKLIAQKGMDKFVEFVQKTLATK